MRIGGLGLDLGLLSRAVSTLLTPLALPVTGLLDELPDVVVSGINYGANMGDDTIYSGTVAAATEGFLLGIPSVAISLIAEGGGHFETAARVARAVLG